MDAGGDNGDGETPPTSSDELLFVVTPSTGLMGEFLNDIRTEIELNTQNLTSSDSSSDDEEIEFWYLPRFDTANEIRAVSTRYFGQESEGELVTAAMNNESMVSLDESPPSTSYREVHSTAAEPPLTSDEEQETLVASTAMDEAADTDSVVVDPVPEPPRKRRSWLSALGRAVLDLGRKMCCCSGGRRRRRRLPS